MFKDFSISSSGGHLVYWSETFLATLVGSHLGNIPVKFESHWLLEELAFKANYSQFSIFSSGGHFGGTVLSNMVEGSLSNIPIKFE